MTDNKKCTEAIYNLIIAAYSANLNLIRLHTEEDKVEAIKNLVGSNAYLDLFEDWMDEVEKNCNVKFDKEKEMDFAFKERDELKPMVEEIEEYFEITAEEKKKIERQIKEREKRAGEIYV